GRVLHANETFRSIISAAADVPNLYELGRKAQQIGDLLRRVRRDGVVRDGAFALRRSDGSEAVVMLTALLEEPDAGEPVVEALVVDVTERNRAQEELQTRAADLERVNAELEHFASVTSHELQEPLRTVERYT